MIVHCKDTIAKEKCNDSIKKTKAVSLVHAHLCFASVVEVSCVPKKECLELRTTSGVLISDYQFNLVV